MSKYECLNVLFFEVLKEITTLDEIKNLNIDGYIYDNTLSSNQTLTFVKKE